MNKEEFKKFLYDNAFKIGIYLSEEQLEIFYRYKELIIEWNKKINLTAITKDEDFAIKHFIDSITINKFIENDSQKIIDIGTGAGFPGIPIKILRKSNVIVLLDSLNKRLKVLDNIIKELGLENIETLHGRAEEIFKQKENREQYDIAVSRAVASLNVLAELMLPSIKSGGKCICMKGLSCQEEIEHAKKSIELLGGKIENIEKVILPELNQERNIVIISKVKPTPSIYPRKPGTPQKLPL